MPQRSSCSLAVKVCTVLITIIMLIAQSGVGWKYLHDCPKLPFIPIYLMVMGGSILLLFLKKCNQICFGVVCLFYFYWFLAGNVCIFMMYNEYETGCNKTLYLFAFWTTILNYILIGVTGVILSCCCKNEEDRGDALQLAGDQSRIDSRRPPRPSRNKRYREWMDEWMEEWMDYDDDVLA